ncbi:hypothetical protein [Xanthomonas phage NEB7]|nr:hypothetical protein [Xanthomonas phage NEB7]
MGAPAHFIWSHAVLKQLTVNLTGADAGHPITLIERPALVADRLARTALAEAGAPLAGGVIGLVFEHMGAVRQLGERSNALLQPFVDADRQPLGWENVFVLQQAALLLHAGFVIDRPRLEAPVAMHVAGIQRGDSDVAVHFCSSHIATVLHSGHATYRELETVLSTEDVFNLVELVNVAAIRDWHALQSSNP